MRHRHGTSKIGELMVYDQIFDSRDHGTCGLIVKSEDHDPTVRPRRISTDVPEATVKGEHHALLLDRSREYLRIGAACQALGEHGVSVDPVLGKPFSERDR